MNIPETMTKIAHITTAIEMLDATRYETVKGSIDPVHIKVVCGFVEQTIEQWQQEKHELSKRVLRALENE